MKTEGYHFEWWTVEILEATGKCTLEIKAKTKENAIRQINKVVQISNSKENLSKPIWQQKVKIREVYWDTLKIDRIGYQRLF